MTRVASVVNYQYDTLYSDAITCISSPYSTTFAPIYMIGSAVDEWDPEKAAELPSTGMPDLYYTKWNFKAGAFRFFTAKDWGASLGGYDVFTVYPTDILGETGDGDSNFDFIGTEGWYEITVDVSTGTVEMTAIDEPLLYLTGDATHGWSWDDPVTSLTWIGYEVWEGSVDFTSGGYFRCFLQKDWSPDSFGYDVITNFDADYLENDGTQGDPNWLYVGATGTYTVQVDKPNATITITP